MTKEIVVKRHAPGWAFEVYAIVPKKGRTLVASGHRSSRALAETAAAREASVYEHVYMRKAGK